MRPSVNMYAVVSSWPSVASTPYSTMMVGSAVIIMLWEMHAAAVPDIMMPSTSGASLWERPNDARATARSSLDPPA